MYLVGFTILVIVVAVLFLRILIAAIREIPNMTVKQFIKFMLALSIVLMVAAIFL